MVMGVSEKGKSDIIDNVEVILGILCRDYDSQKGKKKTKDLL